MYPKPLMKVIKGIGSIMSIMDMEYSIMLLVINIRENSMKAKNMEMVSLFINQEAKWLELGLMINWRAKEYSTILMEMFIKATSAMESNKDMEFIISIMEIFIKAIIIKI